MMFTVLLVGVGDGTNPEVLDRLGTGAIDLAHAAQAAQVQLDQVRAFYPSEPPDGFIVKDERTGEIIRSWDRPANA